MAFCLLPQPLPFSTSRHFQRVEKASEPHPFLYDDLQFATRFRRVTFLHRPTLERGVHESFRAAPSLKASLHNSSTTPKLRLAVLVSGGGRSLENICERIEAGSLTGCMLSLVVASKKTAGAIQKAQRHSVPTRVLRLRDFEGDTESFSEAITALLDDFEVDLVVLAGWMHFYLIPQRYSGKVINIHPSLIPSFCGKGYYGHHVHEAVLAFGAKITGCTVHLADNKYDHGPIILQKAVAVADSDTSDDLAARVFESEKAALPEAIQLFVDGRISVEGRRIRVLAESKLEL